ncbi:SH3 domain-containing protein [Heliorestis acidaminivorans]|uniref:SH3 domain-containing protein n=1 Tax=Heliorestis acidaminivorans TaxID=553427 RepID=A0A6I0EYR8_9FIRM|nr:SH3 domain-containing protein [Heliorestis acidaminivorans]KAB2953646.1 SH3 domain-containing protein [Heliorestis acidaminivorans]
MSDLRTKEENNERELDLGLTEEEQKVLFSETADKSSKRMRKWIKLTSFGLAFTISGFILGQMVIASAITPGSNADPLISRSYFNRILGEQTADLHNQIKGLNQRVEVLRQNVEESTGKKIDLPPMPVANGSTEPTVVPAPEPATPVNNPSRGAEEQNSQTGAVKPSVGVFLRYGPGVDYRPVTTLDQGVEFTILNVHDGVNKEKWYQVRLTDGRTGFIRQDLVSFR